MSEPEMPSLGRTGLVPNFLVLLAAQVSSKGTTLIALILLSRYLGQEFFGRFSIALAIPTALEAIADIGLGQAIVREGAGRPGVIQRDVAAVLPVKLALAASMVGMSYGIARLLELPPDIVEAAFFLAIVRSVDSMTILARSVFEAHEHMEYEAASLVGDAAVRLAFVAYSLLSGFGLVGLAKAYVLSSLIIMSATVLIAVRRFLGPMTPRFSATRVRRLVGVGIPFAALWLLDGLSTRVNTVLLGLIASNAAAGIFAAGSRFIEPLLIIPYTMATALLPLAARHLFEERTTLPSLFTSALKLAVVIAVANAIVLIGAGRALVGIVFGDDFLDAVPIVTVLALALVPLYARATLTNFLVVLDAQWKLYRGQGIGIGIAIVTALLLVPHIGALGTAYAILLGEVIVISVTFASIGPLIPIPYRSIGRTLIAGGLALFVAGLLSPLRPGISVPVALAFLVAAVRMLGVFGAEEVRYLQQAMPRLARLSRLLLAPIPLR